MESNIIILVASMGACMASDNTTSHDDISHDDHTEHHHSDEYGQVLLYFFALGLGLGALTDFFLSRCGIKIAYTLVMFFEGILFALLMNNSELNDFTESMNKWSKLDPYLIMYIFLPILTFSDALELRWIDIQHIYKQSIFLALPGVLIVTVTLGTVVKQYTDWSWALSMLFGSCLAATDPVSVVPVMRTTGASHALTILVLGESLLSEGAATVLFHLFENKVEGESYSTSQTIELVVREFILSITAGVFGGMLAVYLMSFANRHLRAQDSVLQVGLTLICAYFTFYCCQSLFEISGVLAVCSAGVYVSTFGEKVILHHQSFRSVWALVEWAACTLLFLLAGLIVKDKTRSIVEPRHIYHALLLFVVMCGVRGTYIVLSYRFIGAVSGHKITLKEATFLGATGLKGAMGMILSLVVYGLFDQGYLSDKESSDFLVYAALLITLSMFCGGVFTRYFIKLIGLRPKESAESLIVRRAARAATRKEIINYYETHVEEFGHVSLDRLKEFSSLLQGGEDDVARISRDAVELSADPHRTINMVLLTELRRAYLSNVKTHYLHHIECGRLPRHSYSAQVLLNSVSHSLDRPDSTQLGDFELVEADMTSSPHLKLFLVKLVDPLLARIGIKHSFYAGREALYLKRAAYTWPSFVMAHQHALHYLETFLAVGECNGYGLQSDGRPKPIPEVQLLALRAQESVSFDCVL